MGVRDIIKESNEFFIHHQLINYITDLFVPSSEFKHGFIIICLPTEMQVHVARKSLPPFVDPGLLRLDDPRCGVVQTDENDIRLTTPLDRCGTIRR